MRVKICASKHPKAVWGDTVVQWFVHHHKEGCGFNSRSGNFLCGVSMFSLCLHGFSQGFLWVPMVSIGQLEALICLIVRM